MRSYLLLIFILLTGLACNLAQGESDSAARITAIPSVVSVTPRITGSPTVTPTTPSVATATTRPASQATNPPPASTAYVVNLPAPFPACSVSPAGSFTVNIRREATTTGTVVGVLNQNAWVKVKSKTNNWYQIDYPDTPVHNLWISADPVVLNPPCLCEPNCQEVTAPPPTLTCTVTNNTGQVQAIYNEPGLITGEFIARFQPGVSMDVMAFNMGGWIRVKYDVPNVTGWVIGAGMNVSATGCDTIPMEDPTPTRACRVTNNTTQINTLYDQPDSTYVGRFPPATVRYAVAQRSTQWYKIYEPAFSNFYWVEAAFVSTVGMCDSLPQE